MIDKSSPIPVYYQLKERHPKENKRGCLEGWSMYR